MKNFDTTRIFIFAIKKYIPFKKPSTFADLRMEKPGD